VALALAVVVALAFDFTNGFHDSSNAISALVVTRAGRPGPAVVMVGALNLIGPLVVGTAVATTVGGIITVPADETLAVVSAGLTAALAWNLVTWWRGLPSSSSHALVGGLVGAGLLEGGTAAVNWGGFDGLHPDGVIGVLTALAVSPVIGFGVAFVGIRLTRRGLRRARRDVVRVVRRGEWASAAALAFSHGANDAQKTMGVITALLLAEGRLDAFVVPPWVRLASAIALTLGTLAGGWRIVRTLGRKIYRITSLDGLVSQSGSAAVILGGAAVGAPISTTHVVASSVVGVGAGDRSHHVRWSVTTEIVGGWLLTLPGSAVLGMLALLGWRGIT
jgi:PiT family inorganic phosphate transporter